MVLTHQLGVRRWFPPRPGTRTLVVAGVLSVAVVAVIANARSRQAPSSPVTRGSGISVTDHRQVPPFTRIELAGANTVMIHAGAPQSVAVTGDDNLVGRVTTLVSAERLVIDNTGSFTVKAPMHVDVSVPSLAGVELRGAGTVTVDGVTGTDFTAALTGSGTLAVSGAAQRASAVLTGDGTLDLHDLRANGSIAQLEGTGTIRVHAVSTLDATLKGTGTILYRGDPAVTMHKTGTGTVAPG